MPARPDADAPVPEFFAAESTAARLEAARLLEASHTGGTGRGMLVRAEAAMVTWRHEEAEALLAAARASGEPGVATDARLMEAMLASARGRTAGALEIAEAAVADAEREGEADRAAIARAFAAFVSVYAAPEQSAARLEALGAPEEGTVAAVYAGLTRCMLEFNRGDHAAVARRLQPLVEQAARLGMVQPQLRMQNTLAAAYSNLDDKDTAISWVERSIEQARAQGWPVALGEALAFLGNFYRESGQSRRAIETLEEARQALAAAPGSRGHALACCYLAHARLDAGDAGDAVERAREAEATAQALNAVPIVIDVATVAGRAMARAGRPLEGLAQVRRALDLAQATSDEAQRIGNRLLAVEARHQVERQRLETESQRRIAQAQQARAEALDRANAELRKAQAELEILASTDPMTGVANRRSFLAAAEAEVARSLRYRRPLALAICDIDRFKSINDSLGHPCGDRVIGAAALTLDGGRRATDRLGRIGGEEFALLLPETDVDTAFAVAERLRGAIEAARVEWEGRRIAFTMSFGVAVLDAAAEPGTDPFAVLGALIQRADAALYEAKEAGRNRLAGR